LLADHVVADQTLGALQVAFGERQVGLGLRKRGARLIESGLERASVDRDEGVALLHHLAVLEMDGAEVT
jgi:hypothetical protein